METDRVNIPPIVQAARRRVEAAFARRFGDAEGITIAMAPGRVNLIGEHTDYNDGFVFPMTIDRAVYVGLRARPDSDCRMYSANFDSDVRWSMDAIERDASARWAMFVKGVLHVLLSAGYPIRGVDGVIYGDVPIGSGLSSSAAIETAVAFALQQAFHLDIHPVEMIKLCQRAENEFVGVQCGIMDQFASRMGRKGHALFLDCRTLAYDLIPFSFEKVSLLIVDTKMKRELVQSAYNQRRAECNEAVHVLHLTDPAIRALRDVSLGSFEERKNVLSKPIRRRARHVITENQRVHDAIVALETANMGAFGELMFASHTSLKDDYEVSCPELDSIVDSARRSGALGARLTGAGFGGCALVLTERTSAGHVASEIQGSYRSTFGLEPGLMTLSENFETCHLSAPTNPGTS